MLKILFRHLSLKSLLGFTLANLLGLLIVLCGIQGYRDLRPVFSGGDSFMTGEYMVLTKKVSTLNTLAKQTPAFSTKEVETLRNQAFTKSLGVFTPALFDVRATVAGEAMGARLSTAMFFEAVPDQFVDIPLDKWDAGREGYIPIIVPKNYLTLYNFGFATSRGLPSLSEELLQSIELEFRLRGRGGVQEIKGQVVGFSDRINTILVPQKFLDEANNRLSPGRLCDPSRLILEVDNPADEALRDYLARNRYEVEGGKDDAGKINYLFRLVTGVVIAIGAVISVLALYTLLLSIFLILQKLAREIDNLLLIGYSVRRVARPYILLGAALNGACWILGSGLLWIAQKWSSEQLLRILPDYEPASLWVTLGWGALLIGVIIVINTLAIRHKVLKIWNIHKTA